MENITNGMGTICGPVTGIDCCELLVCDHATGQEVLVHTPNACCFSCGDCVCVHHCGFMTMSLPPQVTATCVKRVTSCGC
ncbi:MAG: hypothetical protein HFF50_07285 [Lawsonibacter sp.]|nr:hypothetical protein [Lawsonibacter sp.]